MTDLPSPSLRNQLLAQEPPDSERIRKLEQEITSMWNHKLTHAHRFYWILSLIGAAVLAIPSGIISALYMPDPWMRIIWWLFTASNVVAALFAIRVLHTGSTDFRQMLSIGKAGSGLTFAIALLLVIRAIANPTLEALAFAIFGLIWLVLAVSMNLWNRIIQAEMTTREQLLRLELRLMGTQANPGE